MKRGTFKKCILLTVFIFLSFFSLIVYGQENEDCLMCHDDPELTAERHGRTVSMYINGKTINKSVHQNVKCAACHTGAAVEEFPHEDNLPKVDCGSCHEEANMKFMRGIHGQALKYNALYAPTCKECHGRHDIISPENPKSRTYKMNIPVLCGKCHREGAPVARTYNISEHNILENYSQSIHGQGLFKSGLIVTATCNDCHGNHLVLPHTSPNSSISVHNIAKTCMKCHARIEEVHKKTIKEELWQKAPGAIPACTDCHPPHKTNVPNVVATISDRACLECHSKPDVHKIVDGKKVSLTVLKTDLSEFVHKNIPCVKCHSDVSTTAKRPCETASAVDCSACHAETSNLYASSGHGKANFKKDPNAPYCSDCHGTHKVVSRYDDTSPTYRTNIPALCGKCHKKDGKAAERKDLKEINAFHDYSTSVHGRGLEEKGLLSAAICTDCHTSHYILEESDERSSIFPKNIPATCATCHKGIYDKYLEGHHAINLDNDTIKFPTCADCHTAHVIAETDKDAFMTEITHQCGFCHKELSETYLDTYHGKAYQLGYLQAARCSDCHNAHDIKNVDDPNSAVGINNIVETCKKCHPDANMKFTGYLAHADHSNRGKFPILYYTYWAMTLLLISVFGFFGLHTLLWIPRSIIERRRRKQHPQPQEAVVYIRRFSRQQRATHIFVIISFILLALTGMVLKFANMEWAKIVAVAVGGVKTAGLIHRLAAIITFGYFFYHLYTLIRYRFNTKQKFTKFIFSDGSLMFNKQDLRDFVATIKWFVGLGPRPQYGRWTYWEKFDYMAVFWGVAVIGLSGLVLWFPELFSRFFPGWFINVAQIIHSDEALLASGFIFTIHFFNTHFRPEAFPMDPVIFLGHVPFEEYKHERPREVEELEKNGELEERLSTKTFSEHWVRAVRIFGFCALAAGVSIIILIIYSLLNG